MTPSLSSISTPRSLERPAWLKGRPHLAGIINLSLTLSQTSKDNGTVAMDLITWNADTAM